MRIRLTLLLIIVFLLTKPARAQETVSLNTGSTATCTLTTYNVVNHIQKYVARWQSNASGSCVASLTNEIAGTIRRIVTIPVNSPTDNYDVELLDELGGDCFDTNGLNRDTANTESKTMEVPISDIPRISITNAGNGKKGILVIYVEVLK